MSRLAVTGLLASLHFTVTAMDVNPLWNFADPAASEAAFRAALAKSPSRDDALTLETQIARSLGLRARFVEAHALLDGIETRLDGAGAEPKVRYLLERGRVFRSSKHIDASRPLFEAAATSAGAAWLADLQIDALHMLALVAADPPARLLANERALAAALASPDAAARRWEASIANNLGMDLHEIGRYDEALAAFRRALAARERLGNVERIRVARWMVAWTLRALKRHDEALADLRALAAEFEAAGNSDGFVFEEIAENLAATGRPDDARPYYARAFAVLSADTSPSRPDAEHLARLERLSR